MAADDMKVFSLGYHIEKDIDKLLFRKWRTPISRTRSAIHLILSYLKGKLCLWLQRHKPV